MKSGKIFSLTGFFIFLAIIGLTSTASIFVYESVKNITGGNRAYIYFAVLGAIVAGAVICTLIDVWRRKKIIEEPLEQILKATEEISKGNFDINLSPRHSFSKYDEYDVIFENINIMAAELSKNEILKNDFISNVSHELKTPIAVIQNYAKLIQGKDVADEKKKEYLTGIFNQSKKLSSLVQNILKLNRLENQSLKLEEESVNLGQLIAQSIETFENIVQAKGIELVCDVDDVTIVGDESYIETIINNLISNAVKFTDKGQIKISLKETKDSAVFSVKDDGCGISSETGKHIFDKFYQGDTSHSGDGNGLGLSIVKKIIDLIGGEIAVESKLGKGSTFTVILNKKQNV